MQMGCSLRSMISLILNRTVILDATTIRKLSLVVKIPMHDYMRFSPGLKFTAPP